MRRFLRYLLLHLLVLTGLLWLGWRYARASDRQVRLFVEADEALAWESEQILFENRARLYWVDYNAWTTRLPVNFRRRAEMQRVYQAAEEVLGACQQLENALIKAVGDSTVGRYSQPHAEIALLWGLIFDSGLQHRLDSLDQKLEAFDALLKSYHEWVSVDQVALPKGRWQRVRMFGGLPLAGVLEEYTRRRRTLTGEMDKVLRMMSGEDHFMWGHGFLSFDDVKVAGQKKTTSGDVYDGKLSFPVGCGSRYWEGYDIAMPVVFQGKPLSEGPIFSQRPSRVEFIVAMPAAGYDVWGRKKQHWQATQQVESLYHDTTFTYTADYIVTRPRLDVTINRQSPRLYRHCRNRLHLYHQMPPPAGTPAAKLVRVTGGHLLPTTTLPELDVVADQPQVQVTVLDPFDGSVVRTETFATEAPPIPTLRLWCGDSVVVLRRGIAAGTRALRVQAEADAWFAAALPQEARYRVAARATLYRRGRAVGPPETLSPAKPELRILPTLARPGDWYVLEATTVERLDGEGKVWPVAVRGEWVLPVY